VVGEGRAVVSAGLVMLPAVLHGPDLLPWRRSPLNLLCCDAGVGSCSKVLPVSASTAHPVLEQNMEAEHPG